MNIIEELESLIKDLKYEPYELICRNNNFEILDDVLNKRLILKNSRSIEDRNGFAGQCLDLCLITIRRIKNRFPELRIQLWKGIEKDYFIGHWHMFILVKNSFFKNKNIIIDPSSQQVKIESELNYKKKELIYDSTKYNEIICNLDVFWKYNSQIPIYLDLKTKNLFSILFNEKNREFILFVNNKPISTLEEIKNITSNKNFLLFCKKINTHEIKKIEYEYVVQQVSLLLN